MATLLRALKEEDLPAVEELDRKQSEKFNWERGLQDLFELPIGSPMAIMDEGEMVGVCFLQAEFQLIATDPRAYKAIVEHNAQLKAIARSLGIRFVTADVLDRVDAKIGPGMLQAGFTPLHGAKKYILDLEKDLAQK